MEIILGDFSRPATLTFDLLS